MKDERHKRPDGPDWWPRVKEVVQFLVGVGGQVIKLILEISNRH